jgi:SpoVK/Ycf46/Vps4 family AAA+-type ATPase
MHGSAARKYGLPNLKGMLLIGVQGCGKSMTAKSVGRLWRLPTLRLDVGAVFTSLVGASENRMRRAIQYMEAMAPCVVWLDEIEKSMAGTGSSDRSDAGTAARVFSTMLTWMSDRTAAVYLVATANNPQTLPAEMIRAGRFDERFFIDLPTIAERREIFFNHIRRFGRDPNMFNMDTLSADDASEHFSGAEIENAIIEAMTNAFSQGGREFITDDIVAACQSTFPLAETMAEQVNACRGWAKDRCRPASERLSVSDRLKRREKAAKRLEEGEKKEETGAMAGVDIGPQTPLTDDTPAPNSPNLSD